MSILVCDHGHVFTDGPDSLGVIPKCTRMVYPSTRGPHGGDWCGRPLTRMTDAEEAAYRVGGIKAYFEMRITAHYAR